MDLKNIKTFMTVVSTGNFTKAASELSFTQSTITAQIQSLERELGFPLFERIGRSNHLTSGGKQFVRYAAQIADIMQKAGSLGEDMANMKGTLRIGVLESLLFAKLLDVLQLIQEEFPKLEIVIKLGQAKELCSLLKSNQLDVIYISGASNSDPALKCCYSKREELVFTAGASNPITRSRVPVNTVFEYPFLTTEPSGYCFAVLREIASRNLLTLKHSITVDSIAAIVTLLSDNRSVAFLPLYSLEKDIQSGRIKVIDTGEKQYYYSQLLCCSDKWISPFMEKLTEIISAKYPENNNDF